MTRCILIADDEELERRALHKILGEEPGWTLVEASHGLQALEVAGREHPDLAILDIKMPGLDGIGVAERLRREFPEMAIIFLTAYDQFDYARSAVRLQVDDFLLKPAAITEVKETVKRVLSRLSNREDARKTNQEIQDRFDSAVRLVAETLRHDLAEGVPDAGQIARFLDLRGLAGGLSALVELRPLQSGAPVHNVARLAESAFGSDRCVAVADGTGAWVRVLLMGRLGEPLGQQLRAFRERVRADLGVLLVIGVAVPPDGVPDVLGLVNAAHRAATLAHPGNPLLLVTLSPPPEGSGGLRADAPSAAVSRALAVLEARHAEDLSLNEVAEEVGLSPSNLSRQLARSTGRGFADCLAHFRIDTAKRYLQSGNLAVKEVSHLVGFHDPAYFARVFRRHENCSPAEYRHQGPSGAPQ